MSPSLFHPITTTNINKGLKTNRVSHSIKKTSSSSPSLSSLLPPNKPQQQRQPVIIYTHSPKIIERHPKDFMALVQKLTGLSRDHSEEETDEDSNPISSFNSPSRLPPPKHEPEAAVENIVEAKYPKEENETSSVITNENNGGYSSMGEVKSCFMAAPSSMTMEPPLMHYMRNLPVFEPNSDEFMCSAKSFFNYPEPFFFP
ncbi:hypothetical protein TanjilG_29230 [Lupinus angustifolius]|uniref:VQ domain-containing protein n=1 Tax=Lupinus angustifolius TaxID=3871 RepID=A0A394DM28_LUPAN|nr:PREDICTED: VQ motif-containing protein 20-like [Lupinus angustifolius]OIW21097.1 hypothetical protein TanjilG_29230 [Lupinus angustifolius]